MEFGSNGRETSVREVKGYEYGVDGTVHHAEIIENIDAVDGEMEQFLVMEIINN